MHDALDAFNLISTSMIFKPPSIVFPIRVFLFIRPHKIEYKHIICLVIPTGGFERIVMVNCHFERKINNMFIIPLLPRFVKGFPRIKHFEHVILILPNLFEILFFIFI